MERQEPGPIDVEPRNGAADGLATALGLAAVAGVAIHAAIRGLDAAGAGDGVLLRNAGLLLLPALAVLLGLRRRLDGRAWGVLTAAIVGVALAANLLPHREGSQTELLAALHLPVLLWAVVAHAHAGGDLRSHPRRLEVVRFTGAWVLTYGLFAIGGGVLTGLTAALVEATGVDAEQMIEWVLPAGAAGAAVIASWVVEARPRVIGGVVPLLAQVFTPLVAVMLAVVTPLYLVGAGTRGFDRGLVGVLDALLVVVLALVLVGQAARDPDRAAGWDDRLQLGTVGLALALDVVVLATMLARLDALGPTPNRVVALGLNLVLLANLAVTAVLLVRFLRGRVPFAACLRWQTAFLPVLVVWAAVVALAFPPLFRFT